MKNQGFIKRIALGIVVASMVIVNAVPIMAEKTDDPTMTVSYQRDATYTLTIPTNVKLDQEKEVSQEIKLDAMDIGIKQFVEIKVKSGIIDGKVTLRDKNGDPDNIKTSIVALSKDAESGIATDAVVAKFTQKVGKDKAAEGGTLYFGKLGTIAAGTYEGTITFTAKIVDVSN